MLTGGRFELGIGTGRPDVREFTEQLGLAYGSGAERPAQVGETIEHLRALEGGGHTPVLIAAGGPRARAFAAATRTSSPWPPIPSPPATRWHGWVAEIRELAGPRAAEIELAMSLFVAGDRFAPGTERFFSVDAATLIERDSLTMLRGSTQAMADELQRRRETLGVSYISVNGAFFEQLVPAVEMLTGR